MSTYARLRKSSRVLVIAALALQGSDLANHGDALMPPELFGGLAAGCPNSPLGIAAFPPQETKVSAVSAPSSSWGYRDPPSPRGGCREVCSAAAIAYPALSCGNFPSWFCHSSSLPEHVPQEQESEGNVIKVSFPMILFTCSFLLFIPSHWIISLRVGR